MNLLTLQRAVCLSPAQHVINDFTLLRALGRNRFAKLVSDSFLKPVSDLVDKSITLGSLCSNGRQGRCDKVFV